MVQKYYGPETTLKQNGNRPNPRCSDDIYRIAGKMEKENSRETKKETIIRDLYLALYIGRRKRKIRI